MEPYIDHEEEVLGRPVDYVEVAAINGHHPAYHPDCASVERLPDDAKAIPGSAKVVSILIRASTKRNAWVGVNVVIMEGHEGAITALAKLGYIHYRNIAGEVHVIYPTDKLIEPLVEKQPRAQLALFTPTSAARG